MEIQDGDYSMTLGELLALAREIKGLSVRDVAALTGLSNPAVSQIETGHTADPCFSSVVKLCDCYGISIERVAKCVRQP